MRSWVLKILFFEILISSYCHAQQPVFSGELHELIAGPSDTTGYDEWFENIKNWRETEWQKIDYNDREYKRPQLSWLRNSFIYVQVMAHDRYLYDPETGKYTINRFLENLKNQYGGIDAVMIWPTYPNIGIDNRNQFDLVTDMPGGINGLKQMIFDFHKAGVRVFFPIMIWDKGTREIGGTVPALLVKEMKEIGADGLNGDTMWGVTVDFRNAYDSLNYPLSLQPELGLHDLKMVEWNTSSWGYFWIYSKNPGVSIYKWLEPRHQVYVTNRWTTDKTNDLQYAFFNGVGYNAWENIWDIWNQITDRDEQAIRRIAAIYRQFPGIWNSADWHPGIATEQKYVFASSFPGLDKTVYTLINRDTASINGRQLKLPYDEGKKYFDIWNGVELKPEIINDSVDLSFPVERNGYGAVLAINTYAIDNNLLDFIGTMHNLSSRPLADYSTQWKPLTQKIVEIAGTDPAKKTPEGMILIPGNNKYVFESTGTMIEGNELSNAVGNQYPWKEHPSRSQKHVMKIRDYYIDKFPVTNSQFKKFMDAANYHPYDDHNFLRDWQNGTYPEGWGNKPVTWVSIEDARAYAAWAGKRLPHEWEWQYAAQGKDARKYPWGNSLDFSKIPPADTGRIMRPPTDVDAFPQGASPFGVTDLVGNIWQWTDEYTDEHSRTAVLKGSGYYRATGSWWYFPRAYEVNKYGKYLLMAPSLDRSGSIGFRCIKDK